MSKKAACVGTLGEYGLHEWLRRTVPYAREVGLGDDAACIAVPDGQQLLVTTDFVHMDQRGRHAGKLVVIQNFSDIICKGGRPIALLLGIRLTPTTRLSVFHELVNTARLVAESYGARLIGGDTKEGATNSLFGVAVGLAKPGTTVGRIGCKAGDVVAVTLTKRWLIGTRWAHVAAKQLQVPLAPRVAAALRRAYYSRWRLPDTETFAAIGTGAVTASIDISDGIGACLQILARQNAVGFHVREAHLEALVDPLANALAQRLRIRKIKLALSPGYDWENLFTIRRSEFASVRATVRDAGGELVRIGEVTQGGGLVITTRAGVTRALVPFASEKLKGSRLSVAGQWVEHRDYD